MLREEAIDILRQPDRIGCNLIKANDEESTKYNQESVEALIMAIKALEQEPCEDCISRKALLEEIENGIKAGNYEEGYEEYPHINDMDDIIECIKYADSVQPEPKTDVLDKIGAEIEQNAYPIVHGVNSHEKGMTLYGILQILDKYKSEGSEE